MLALVLTARGRGCEAMDLTPLQYLLGFASGALVGLSLGLVGGGGSILAVPLMVYAVGVDDPHVAIGTSAFAVAANAAAGLYNHACHGTVRWRCGLVYAAAGIVGAAAGSTVGKHYDGQRLLFLFALVMLVVGVLMLRARNQAGDLAAECDRANAPKVLGIGFVTGIFSGFFGIGGGFLIVPGLVAATGMAILNAIGTSLVAVTAFGLTTAVNYARSGLVAWPLAAAFIGGGLLGTTTGGWAARRLAHHRGALIKVFSALIFAVAAYMLWRSARTLHALF